MAAMCDGGFVADGEFVVPGGDGAVAFEPVDAALDGVALPVESGSKAGGRPPFDPFFAVGVLVGLDRDGRLDPAAAQVAAVGLRGVRLVGQDPVRAGPGPPDRRARGTRIAVEHRNELRAVAALAGGQHHSTSGFWPCSQARCILVVNPPRERPSAWSAGSTCDPTGRLFLQSPVRRAPAAC